MNNNPSFILAGEPQPSGSHLFKTTNDDLVRALGARGHVPLCSEGQYLEGRYRIVSTFDAIKTSVDRDKIVSGNTADMMVSLRDVWASEKSWQITLTVLKDRIRLQC